MTTRRTTTMAAAATLAALALTGACSDDDDTSASTPDDLAAYCDASLAVESFRFPEIDPGEGPDVVRGTLADVAADYRPLLDTALDVIPDEVRADGETLVAAFEEAVASGDVAGFDEPSVVAASDRLHAYDLDHCGWNAVEVTAREYEFAGLPGSVPAGVTSFELTNDGDEVHHMVVVRVDDDVDLSVEELLELDEEEAAAYVTFPVEDPLALPGASDHSVADLEPGRYVVACFVPVGTTDLDAMPEGPPHFTQGMVGEFTVE